MSIRSEEKIQLSPQTIWNLNHHEHQEWGIYGYKVPRKYLGSVKSSGSLRIQSHARSKTAPIEAGTSTQQMMRQNFIDEKSKKFANTPAPWSYDTALQWSSNPLPFIVTARGLKQKNVWQNIQSTKVVDPLPTKRPTTRIQKDVKKHTYIDQIIAENTSSNYPKPAPNTYFIDSKGAQRFYPDKKELVSLPSSKVLKNSTLA